MAGWLSTKQASERLGVSEASVRRWGDSGLLRVHRVGKRGERRFKPQDLDRFTVPSRMPAPRTASDPRQVLVGGTLVAPPFHMATFYDSDVARLRLTGPFLADGLREGHPCYLLAVGDELASYIEALRRAPGVDVDAALRSGQLQVSGAAGRNTTEALEFWERELWAQLDNHATVVRAVGEMVSERTGFDSEREMLAYEAALSTMIKRFPAVVICQYDVRRFSGEAIFSALRAHPDIARTPLGLLLK